MKLTNSIRFNITTYIVKQAFSKISEDLTNESNDLANAVLLNHYKADGIVKIDAIPTGWLQKTTNIYANAEGWRVLLRFKTERAITLEGSCSDFFSVTGELSERVRALAQREKQHTEDRDRLRRQLNAMLNACSTIAKFYEAMPEARELIKDMPNIDPVPNKSLVVTGKTVMCMIAKAKGEARDGCSEGAVIEVASTLALVAVAA